MGKKEFDIINTAYINILILQFCLEYMQYYSYKLIMQWFILCVLTTFTSNQPRKQKKTLSEKFISPCYSLISLICWTFINSWLYFHYYILCVADNKSSFLQANICNLRKSISINKINLRHEILTHPLPLKTKNPQAKPHKLT